MKIYILILCIIFPLLLCAFPVSENLSLIPALAYSEDTSVMLGGVAVYAKKDSTAASYYPSNKAIIQFLYTFNNQATSNIVFGRRIKQLDVYDEFKLQLRKWPEDFYGFGNSASTEVIESFTANSVGFENDAKFYVNSKFKISILTSLFYSKLSELEANGLDKILTENEKEYTNLGLGLGFELDTRDHYNYPTKGYLVKTNWTNFSEDIISDFSYDHYLADLRSFIPLSTNTVLGSQVYTSVLTGDVPFDQLVKLGNEMRGYDATRFRDKGMFLSRLELRSFPFKSGFMKNKGVVLFSEFGQVFDTISEAQNSKMHYSAGFGFRFQLVKKEKINFRLDFAFGEDDSSFTISALEVF
jgi:outer membrane protein assembly factor BamA